jgi:coenzyme F420-reducing hydrogenase beta subunit
MNDPTAILIRQPDGSLMERTGVCSRCGDCCIGCPLIRLQSFGVARCAGYGTARLYLQGCDRWPSEPEHVAAYPRCTYRFRRVSE